MTAPTTAAEAVALLWDADGDELELGDVLSEDVPEFSRLHCWLAGGAAYNSGVSRSPSGDGWSRADVVAWREGWDAAADRHGNMPCETYCDACSADQNERHEPWCDRFEQRDPTTPSSALPASLSPAPAQPTACGYCAVRLPDPVPAACPKCGAEFGYTTGPDSTLRQLARMCRGGRALRVVLLAMPGRMGAHFDVMDTEGDELQSVPGLEFSAQWDDPDAQRWPFPVYDEPAGQPVPTPEQLRALNVGVEVACTPPGGFVCFASQSGPVAFDLDAAERALDAFRAAHHPADGSIPADAVTEVYYVARRALYELRSAVPRTQSGCFPASVTLYAQLAADPATAVLVFDALRTSKILRPWRQFPPATLPSGDVTGETWWVRDSLDGEPAGHELVQDGETGLWFDGSDDGQLVGWTLAEGMQRLDSAARERGVLLAGPSSPPDGGAA